MAEQDTKKQTDTEFICKLLDMIEKYPKIINWTNDGKKMIIFDILQMQQLILPQYFRHKNFPSFIRQLNMYDFHKLQKNDNQIIFRNDIFIRGNEKNFHFIQRKKKIKQQFLQTIQFEKKSDSILKRLKHATKIQPQTKDAIYSLLEFKYLAYENTKKIKHQLDKVVKQLKDCRSKKIAETLKLIKGNLVEAMSQQLRMSKDIDSMMENSFLVEKEGEKENKEFLSNMGHFVGSQFHLPIFGSSKLGAKELFFDCNRMRSRPSFIALQSNCGYWSINDMNNIQPIFFSTPKELSEVNLGSKNNSGMQLIEKGQESNDQEDDSMSMGMIGEDELKFILRGQEEMTVPKGYGHGEQVKCNDS